MTADDRTVQVPSQIIDRDLLILTVRDVSADHHGNGWLSLSGPEAARIADAVIALLSQPTPTAAVDRCRATVSHAPHEWNVNEGEVGFGSRCPGVAEPPRIEDLAPGTTFTATFRYGDDAVRFIVETPQMVRAHLTGVPWRPRDLDPTTIRDVTPPAQACTCPSGDGSLRWPCPAHPPKETP